MTGTDLLDAAIGVIFVILCFSLVASAVQEALATVLNWRGRMLRRGLFRLLEGASDGDLVDLPFPGRTRLARARLTLEVLADPAIRVLHGPRGLLARLMGRVTGDAGDETGRLPSAIPPESFSRALIDTLARRIDFSAVRGVDGLAVENAEAALLALEGLVEELAEEADRALRAADGVLATVPLDPTLRDRLRRAVGRLAVAREVRIRLDRAGRSADAVRVRVDALLAEAEAGLAGLREEVGAWFDRSMDRVSGWYARRARLALFSLGVAMALAVNVDLSLLGRQVLTDPGLREALVISARERIETGLPAGPAVAGQDAEAVAATLRRAREEIATLPGRAGPAFGRDCGPEESWIGCAWRTLRPSAVISWLIIGLGCMMGGQFWYEMLGFVLRFRPAARVRRA